MGKLKAKLTALFMAVGCFVACLGIGVGLFAPKMPQASAEMTAEQLEQEFTNNGQFTLETYRDDMPYEIVESTAEGVPAGAEGAVLKITGTGDKAGTTDGAFAKFVFKSNPIITTAVTTIRVRVHSESINDFRVAKSSGGFIWTASGLTTHSWNVVDVPIVKTDGEFTVTEYHNAINWIAMGLRRATVCYIDSVEVLGETDAKKEFTNNGQFDIARYSTAGASLVDGAAEGLPEGYEGTVLKIEPHDTQYINLDFSAAKLLPSELDRITAKCYLANAYADGAYTKNKYEFRMNNESNSCGGAGYYEVSDWFVADINIGKIATDANGYLTTTSIGLRNKGNHAAGCCFYIDEIVVAKNAWVNEFTNGGQFKVKKASFSTGFTVIDGATEEGLPAGWSGAVLKVTDGAANWDDVCVDFSVSNILAADVKSIVVRAYATDFVANGDSGDEFRTLVDNAQDSQKRYSSSTYNLSTWCDVVLTQESIATMTDENGYLKYIDLSLRDKVSASIFYIDSITLDFYDIVQVGKVEMYGVGTNSTRTDRLYLKPTDQTVTWYETNDNFIYESGTGFQVIRGGEVIYQGTEHLANRNSNLGKASNIKNFYIELRNVTLQAGDIVRYGGKFYNATAGMKYVIEDSEVLWDGQSWGKVGDYTTHQITELKPVYPSTTAGSASNKAVYLKMQSGATLPFRAWENLWYFESGDGLKLNGETVTMNSMQSAPEGIYISFNEVAVGDVLTLSGTFRCPMQKLKYEIAESSFTWDGSVWSVYVDFEAVLNGLTEYKPTQIGGLCAKDAGGVVILTAIYLYAPNEAEAFPKSLGDWGPKYTFLEGSGDGVTLGGNAISMDDIKFPGDFYVAFGRDVTEGEIFTIDGTFYNVDKGIKFTFTDFALQWDGAKWVKYIEYETKELGTLVYDSVEGAGNIYVNFKDSAGKGIPVYSMENNAHWTTVFAYESGAIKYNDAAISATVKVTGKFFVDLARTPQTGDKLTIVGRFYNKTIAWEYIVEESTFEWNGTAWVEYIEYTTYTVSAIAGTKDCNATQLHVSMVADKEIPSGDWANYYKFQEGSGDGVMLNDAVIAMNDIKHPYYFYVGLGTTAVRGDKVTIDGTFYNETLARKFVFENCVLYFDGTSWVDTKPQDMQTYDLGALKVHPHSAGTTTNAPSAVGVYLTPVSVKLPIGNWTYYFTKVSGTGILVNNVESTTAEMISAVVGGENTNGQLYIKSFGTFNKGDVLTVGGTFVCEGQYTTYVITDTSFVWTGEIWELYVNYTTHNVGDLAFVGLGVDNNTKQAYFRRADEGSFVLGSDNNDVLWNTSFSWEGNAITINGKAVKPTVKVPGDMFIEFASAPVKGDVLVIGGTFYCPEFAIKYVVTESKFVWDGAAWSSLAAYDEVTMEDLGLPNGLFINQEVYNGVQNVYTKSANNTTGSVVFAFGYNSTNVRAGAIDFRLRGENWRGFTYRLAGGKISVTGSSNTKSFTFANNVDYVVELGTIDLMNGTSTWVYIKINGEFVSTGTIEKTATMQESSTSYEYSTFTTNKISIYANADVKETLFMHPDYVAVKYMTERPFVEFVEKGEAYNLSGNRTNTVLIGWVGANNNLYQVGEEVQVQATMAFSPVEIDYTMEAGASIRLADSADYSGIRFTAFINNAQLDSIKAQYGITDVEYGMLILPYDDLTNGQMPNLDDYVPGETILKIPADNFEDNGDIIQFRGAMQKLYTENYGRFFAGRGYLQFTVNGEQWTIYTQFDYEDNVRSVRYVASEFKKDTAEYNKISAEKKAVVEAYVAADSINLIDYETYATTEGVASANNPFKVMAWNFPKLDTTNGYFNEANEKIATDMKNAGIQIVILAGENLSSILPNTPLGRERMHQVIRFFNSQGLQTMAFLGNATKKADTESEFNALPCDFVNGNFADFADCDGFLGFLTWDEPYGRNEDDSYNRNEYKATLNKIKDIVNSFEVVYANTDMLAWANLLPSYASFFDKSTFVQYLQDYCDIVLAETDGEKWLSIDTYPIMKDYSLIESFLYDLGMLKKVALEKSAVLGDEIKTHVILQSSGWNEGNDDKSRIPTEAEMRMQAYSAMAFGIDTMSWFTYSPSSSSGGNTYYSPVDSNGNIATDGSYTAFSNVNKELQAISKVYSSFTTWKGVILGKGVDNSDPGFLGWGKKTDYAHQTFSYVEGTLGAYQLSASNTKHLSGVATNKGDWNYLMGVMEDVHGNEAYVLADFNQYESSRAAQTITLTFASNITEVVIYRGGVAQTMSVSNKSLAVSLSVGEGVIILPSKLG